MQILIFYVIRLIRGAGPYGLLARPASGGQTPYAHENSLLTKLIRAAALRFRDKQPKSTVVYLPGPPTHFTPSATAWGNEQ